MKKRIIGLIAGMGLMFIALSCGSKESSSTGKTISMPENTKITINETHYFKYKFSQSPALGTIVLRIQVFDSSNKQVTPFVITGESGMPSMAGHHESGMSEFRLNKKNDYLLPVDIVMPGDWEVRIIIKQNSKEIFKGKINFDV
jgi:hypothetical protein